MYNMTVNMPKDPNDITDEIRSLTKDGKLWFYLNNEAIAYFIAFACIEEIGSLLKIQYGNVRMLLGQHTVGWWRVYFIEGDVIFKESTDPEYVVFMKG